MREGVKINLRECGGTFRVVIIVVYLLSFMKIRASLYVRHIFIYIFFFSHVFGSQGEWRHSTLFSLIR